MRLQVTFVEKPGKVGGAGPAVNDRPGDAEAGCANADPRRVTEEADRKSTRLNSSHSQISYAVFCLKKKQMPESGTAIVATRLWFHSTVMHRVAQLDTELVMRLLGEDGIQHHNLEQLSSDHYRLVC